MVYFVKELAIFAVFHENVNFGIFFYHLIDLSDVLMPQVFLKLDLFFNNLQVL